MENSFFSTADLGLGPKIRVSRVGEDMHFDWDRDDPELIEAGINDLTPEHWAEITRRCEEMFANQPVLEVLDGKPQQWVLADGPTIPYDEKVHPSINLKP